MIVIRKATLADLSSIQELSQELFHADLPHDPLLNEKWTYQEGEKYFKDRMSEEKFICFVAESDGKIIGYATGSVLPILAWRPIERVELENLIVTEEYRSQGVGKMLIDTFAKWGKEKGAKRILVSAYAINDRGISFYERNGFKKDSLQLEKEI